MKFLRLIDAFILWFTPTKRTYIYAVSFAFVMVASSYGLVEGEKLSAIGYLLGAVLGMAIRNVPRNVELPSDEAPVEWEDHD